VVTVDDREPSAVRNAVRAHSEVAEPDVERLGAGAIGVGSIAPERKTLAGQVS
jgi:hypothetical protein